MSGVAQRTLAARSRIVAAAILLYLIWTAFFPPMVSARNVLLPDDFSGNEATGLLILRQSLNSKRSWRQLSERVSDPLLVLREQEKEAGKPDSNNGDSGPAKEGSKRLSARFPYALTAGILCAALRSTQREREASEVEQEALHTVQNDPLARRMVLRQLVETAVRAKQTRLHHLAWGWETNHSMRSALTASALSLITIIIIATDIAYTQLKPKWTKARNGIKTWFVHLGIVFLITVSILTLVRDSLLSFLLTLGGWGSRAPSVVLCLAVLFAIAALLLRMLSNARLLQANNSMNTGNFETCLKQCEEGLRKHPRSVGFLVTASAAALRLEDFESAIKHCNEALRIAAPNDKELATTYNNLSAAYVSIRNDRKAFEFVLKALESNPRLPQAQFLKVISLCNLNRVDEAWEEIGNIEDDFLLHYAKASVLYAKNLRNEAMTECELATCTGGPNLLADTLPLRAVIRADNGNLSQAIEDFSLAITANPRRAAIRAVRARYYAISERYEKAEEDMGIQSSFPRPDYWLAYTCNTRAIIALKQNKDALPHAEQANRLFPEDSDFLVQLGMAQFQKQNFEKAMDALSKAILLNKYCAAAYHYRAQVYNTLHQLDEASRDKEIATNFNFQPYL